MTFKLVAFAIRALVIVACFHKSSSQVSKIGSCPSNIKPVAGFKASDFKGDWYEVQRYPSVQIMGRCVSINYTPTENTCRIKTTQTMPGMNSTTSESSYSYEKNIGKWNYMMNLGLGKQISNKKKLFLFIQAIIYLFSSFKQRNACYCRH